MREGVTVQVATQTVERRTGTQKFVQDMIAERQEMWVLYCKAAGLEPFTDEAPVRQALDVFGQVLVDYISAGHFGLYERIAAGKERRRAVRAAAGEVYEEIARTTDVALAFNDRYEAGSGFALDTDFAKDLSELGEALALRIELEDRILARML